MTRNYVASLPLNPFVIFDPESKELMIIPALKFDAFTKPRYNFLRFAFINGNLNHSIVAFIQASCNPPVLFESNKIGYLTGENFIQVSITESLMTVDNTIGESASIYPYWFPENWQNEKQTKYDWNVCEAFCCALKRSENETIASINQIQSVDFLQNWKPEINEAVAKENNSTFPNLSNETDCEQICPKPHIWRSVRTNTHLMSWSKMGSLEFPIECLDLYTEASKMAVKEMRFAKSFGEFISEIGGHMGLMIGASLITILEICEYFILLLSRSATISASTQ